MGSYPVFLTVQDTDGFAISHAEVHVTILMDTDLDGTSDIDDIFPRDATEWDDTDSDGVGDNADTFPDDPAASVDTDGDGYPDVWNAGKTELDSTTGLKLDLYPEDPKQWEKSSDSGFIPGFELVIIGISFAISVSIRRKK